MIIDYNGYEQAIQRRTETDIDDLAALSELSPASFKMYGDEYHKRHTRQQKQTRQTKQPERKGGKMFMTFKEYEAALDTAGNTSLMGGNDNLRKISAFAREYPSQYSDYRERLRNKQQEQQNARRF